jgi:hypothetical protein
MGQSLLADIQSGAGSIWRGRVLGFGDDGSVITSCDDDRSVEHICDVLQMSDGGQLRLSPDDLVAVWLPVRDQDRGIILGRIGSSQAPRPETRPEETDAQLPDELVIEAKHSLTLRVGEGSITIREDGKILIKGKDLVSHAKRLNRIKGGAVQIN